MLFNSRRAGACSAVLCMLSVLLVVPAAQALRIVNYNVTNYPGNSSGLRNPKFRTIMAPLLADIVVVQEMTSQTGIDSFRTRVLNFNEPGQWASAPFINGNDTDNALFYKPAKVTLLGNWAFYPNPDSALRLVSVYRFKPVGYTASAAEFRIYSQHLKASQGFESQRLSEAIGIRDSMNALPVGSHAILMGDFNIYTSTEPAFQKFLQSQADNDGRLYDPLNAVGNWHDGATFAPIHSQCPCINNCPAGFGFAGGGLDDRFDMFLPTLPLANGSGLELIASTYKSVGNDGQHLNKDINAAPVIPEGQAYADALVYCSDHLPQRVDISLPAEITVASSLPFGTVIVGATAQQSLNVTNAAVAPADNLDYSFTADAGFTAPGGSFQLTPGSTAPHTITMDTATSGAKSGQVHVTSDAVDTPLVHVNVTGTVLDHAIASLDSGTVLLARSLDFGDHEFGSFPELSVRAFNLGYDASQARLAMSSASITGPGAERFAIVGGFSPLLLSGVGYGWTLHFEAAGAPTDSTYAATLTFASGDEPLPGATAQPSLVVSLQARVLSTDTESALPTVTRLFTPYPNPPGAAGTMLRYDLVQASDVRLEVFDVAGRRLTALANAPQTAGVHRMAWDGRDAAGRTLGAGVYFVRMQIPGFATQTVRVTMLR